MRSWSWTLALALLAGCVGAPDEAVEGASANATELAPAVEPPVPPAPTVFEGTVWLPSSTSQEREETLVPFALDLEHSSVTLRASLGARYGPLELPATLADVVVEVRDAAGEVVGELQLTMGEPSGELVLDAHGAGEGTLALLSYGGSDGSGNGDHVDYRLEVQAAQG